MKWLRTGDAQSSVVTGLARIGRVIGSAALIMIAGSRGVASPFDVTPKTMDAGVVVAALIDAMLVRSIPVPATTSRRLDNTKRGPPTSLDRVLP
ncbi:hypothetical protein [Streptomyces sp. SID3343]|uniref:hypothetical protein n=1 Tax=Streptomyces sp. SID3343 TaxID=2690260 RepID=UPI0013683A3A|nr:hypothetical protein [Streptomyces sp. SID3343]MYW01188.1 hypothetical protein [Streptomyces sp. SID3343]